MAVINFTVNGIAARLTTSTGYGVGEPDNLILLIHGNNGNYTYEPSSTFKTYCAANKISFACISGQDYTAAPFGSNASGWGGDVHRVRVVNLYDYLMKNYDFNASVIVIGASMGGLVMGQLAYYKPFPIKFCIGVGLVPSLEYIFKNGVATRQPPIRNAFGMAADGSQDSQIADFISGADWYRMGVFNGCGGILKRIGFARMYLYAGSGDTTYANEFNGDSLYPAIRDSIKAAGGFCALTILPSVSHASATIYDRIISDDVLAKELGI